LDFISLENYDYISNVPGGGQVNQSNTSGDAWQQIGSKQFATAHYGLNGAAVKHVIGT
jgi:hypothetical protein